MQAGSSQDRATHRAAGLGPGGGGGRPGAGLGGGWGGGPPPRGRAPRFLSGGFPWFVAGGGGWGRTAGSQFRSGVGDGNPRAGCAHRTCRRGCSGVRRRRGAGGNDRQGARRARGRRSPGRCDDSSRPARGGRGGRGARRSHGRGCPARRSESHRRHRRPRCDPRPGRPRRPGGARRAGDRPARDDPRVHRLHGIGSRPRCADPGDRGGPGGQPPGRPAHAPQGPVVPDRGRGSPADDGLTMAGQGAVGAHVSLVPEAARPFQGAAAGVVSRVVAGVIDGGVVTVVVGGAYLAGAGVLFLWRPRALSFPAPAFSLVVVIAGLVLTGYLAWSWTTTGRTYGDHVLGLRVVDAGGARLRLGRATLRALACALLPLGLFWVAVSRGNRSLQDLLVRSFVIYDWIDATSPVRGVATEIDRVPRQRAAEHDRAEVQHP